MGSSNIMRLLNEALRQGETFPLTSGQNLKFLPATDNVGAVHIGNGTLDMDFKIFMGETTKYVEWDISVPQVNVVSVPHVFTGSDITVNTGSITMNTGTLKMTSGDIQHQGQVGLVSGAITIKSGIMPITKVGVAAMTLASPIATTDDYKRLLIVAATAAAHTVTQTAPGFNNAGVAADVATFAAVGDSMEVMAYQGVWYVVSLRGVLLS